MSPANDQFMRFRRRPASRVAAALSYLWTRCRQASKPSPAPLLPQCSTAHSSSREPACSTTLHWLRHQTDHTSRCCAFPEPPLLMQAWLSPRTRCKEQLSLHHRAPITPFGLGSVEGVWSTNHARIDSEPMGTTAAGAPWDTTFACSDSFPCRCRGRRRRRCCLTCFMQLLFCSVLVEPASPPAVELLAEAFVRFLAICPP